MNRYAIVVPELANRDSLGQDTYPANVTDAYNILVKNEGSSHFRNPDKNNGKTKIAQPNTPFRYHK